MKKWKKAAKAFNIVSNIALVLGLAGFAIGLFLAFTILETEMVCFFVEGMVSMAVYFIAYQGSAWAEAEYARHKRLARRK